MNDYIIFGDESFGICDTYYGGYRTRTFSDIFPSPEDFIEEYKSNALYIDFEYSSVDEQGEEIKGLTLLQLYAMLYAHYGNSHISYSDENQFRYYLYSIIFQYGPTASKKLYVQNKLRSLSDDKLMLGSRAIYNHAFNPSTAPSTSTLEELLHINDQNTTNYVKSQMEGYANLLALLEEDVIDEFIHKFKRLFIKVLAPDYPLLYTTEVPN